jgi:murein tripeptide amidase MpaA
MVLRRLLLGFSFALLAPAGTAAAQELSTVAERSGFLKTGRYDEVVTLCTRFAARYPDAVRCETFGTTPEGRPMKALVASRSGALDAAAARARGLPVLLVQGGIHAGEIDGKDAGFWLLRQLLDGEAAPGALDAMVLVFVPVFNVDGHERFGRWNRPNQNGPEEMGWRTTAQNYNLNRDYLKADTPEMQAMLQLVEAWDPIVTMDLHVTNGAKFEHDISVQVEPLNAGDAAQRQQGLALRGALLASLSAQGSLPLPFYPSFVEGDNPASGFVDSVPPPRFSHGYFHLRNRFGILVETHSWKDYPTRVRATRNTVEALVRQAAARGRDWLATARRADARAARVGGSRVPLDYAATDKVRTIEFRGYAYTRTPSDVSGALMTRYDDTVPQVWRVPLRDQIAPSVQVAAPRGGYLVPPAFAAAVTAKLDAHGIRYRRLGTARPGARVQAWRADSAQPSARSTEGRQRLEAQGRWDSQTQDIAAGTVFVPIAQPRSRLAMALLEPQAPDSLLQWGWFNNAFEQKEYMEGYVAEAVARDMLKDAQVKAAFERKLKDDPEFAKSPQARLDFFYRRHSAYDERYLLYPITRTETAVTP